MKNYQRKHTTFATLLMILLLTSCHNEEGLHIEAEPNMATEDITMVDIVSQEEYTGLTLLEKDVVDMINSTINGLKGLALHNKDNLSQYKATFNINTEKGQGFENYILFTLKNPKEVLSISKSQKGACRACGLGSGIRCAKQIIRHIKDNGLNSLDVNISVDGDCYNISY